jgi:putative Mn2+ efflux pump MntP
MRAFAVRLLNILFKHLLGYARATDIFGLCRRRAFVTLFELFIIAAGLSMDAFAVAVCNGLSMQKVTLKSGLIVGLYFGAFQAGMPALGYLVGTGFADKITAVDHWVAFILLGIIGGNMIKESLDKKVDISYKADQLSMKNMIPMAVATSIDALAAGVSFALIDVDIVPAVSFIGIITFTLSFIGVKMGSIFGVRLKSRAELLGGIILILMGIKILLEHMGILS